MKWFFIIVLLYWVASADLRFAALECRVDGKAWSAKDWSCQ